MPSVSLREELCTKRKRLSEAISRSAGAQWKDGQGKRHLYGITA